MSPRGEVLMWAQRILGKKNPTPYHLLEIKSDAGLDVATDAFHRVARMAHPDLHRNGLSPEEFEQVTLAYAKVAGAYQELRMQRMTTTKIRPLKDDVASVIGQRMAPGIKGLAPTAGRAVPEAPPPQPNAAGPSNAMNSKALLYYRKAELGLRRGDVRGALLQIKMAIAADPASVLLRNALAELQAELAKKP